jgi:hypothetical protein
MEIQIDFMNTGILNEEKTELRVHMSSNGWDSRRLWREDLENAAQNNNDIITEPVLEALESLGLTLSEEDHEFDEDRELIIYRVIAL